MGEEPSSDDTHQVRKVITVRRKIVRRIIVLPDGTRKEVEEEVPSEETDSDFDVVERKVESSTEEVIAEPTVVEEQQTTPDVPHIFEDTIEEPKDEIITKREVHRTVVVPTETKESVDVIPSETEEEPSSDDTHQVRKVITVRRKIVRRIIVLPDGTRKEVEEEVPSEETDSDFDVVEREVESSTEEVIAEPTVVEEQQTTPDVPHIFEDATEEPQDEIITKREVHRTVVVPTETK